MATYFNNNLLQKMNNILLLKHNNNIIVDVNNSNHERLNAKIIKINKENNTIFLKYYSDSNDIMLDMNKYKNLICLDEHTIYKPYPDYPFYSTKKNTKYGNKFVFEYYKKINTIHSLQSDYYNLIPSINYSNLPKILEQRIKIKYPIRLHNKYDSILGCIIDGLPKIVKKNIEIESDNIEKYYRKYIILHMNNNFIKNIENKYNISFSNILDIKYQLEDKIKDHFLLAIVCSEIFKINIKIFKYVHNEDIDLYDINDKELVTIHIYNTTDMYELITSKQFIMER